MNSQELRELARLVGQAFYEVEEFGKVQTEGLWRQLYTLIQSLSLTIVGTSQIEGRDDAMQRLLLAELLLYTLSRDIHDLEIQKRLVRLAREVNEVKCSYSRIVYD